MRDPLAEIFNVARNAAEYERIQKVALENERRDRREEDHRKDKERDKQNMEFAVEVSETQRRIAELEARMAETYKILEQKYGDDVIGGMTATWLTEEEAAGLTTDDERLRAISNKLLDEDGAIKPPYEDIPDAHYVRDWSELETAKNSLNTNSKPETPSDEVSSFKPADAVPF